MDTSEWLTRGTVWLALSLHVASEVVKTSGRAGGPGAARWLNTLGGAVFLAHVACAFHFYHGWSHARAYADTARQTAQLSGWNWGGGLYVNYLFALVWLAEIFWSWANPGGYLQRAGGTTWSIRSFFLFMMVNGAVVFARGNVRWFGLILCLTLVACWWRGQSRKARPYSH